MDFVFHLIDNKDIVSGNPALCFQEEIRFDPFRREPAEPFRLFEIAFLGGYTFQGRVGSLVVTGDIPGKVPAQFLQGVEVFATLSSEEFTLLAFSGYYSQSILFDAKANIIT